MILDILENVVYIKCSKTSMVYGIKDNLNNTVREVPRALNGLSHKLYCTSGKTRTFYKNAFNKFVEKITIEPLSIPSNLADNINYICMDAKGNWKCFKLRPHIRIRTGSWKTKKYDPGFPKEAGVILKFEWPLELWQTSLHYKDVEGVWKPYVDYNKM